MIDDVGVEKGSDQGDKPLFEDGPKVLGMMGLNEIGYLRDIIGAAIPGS